MSISNLFGVRAWNAYHAPFTNRVTLIVSNRVFLTLTNNFNWGYDAVLYTGAKWTTNAWTGWSGNPYVRQTNNFVVPLLTNVLFLPPSYWSESTRQFISFSNSIASSPFESDLTQTGWPVHAWILNITNDLMYSLIDNQSGQVLDYVNLGAFGSSLNITQQLLSMDGASPVLNPWEIGNATDQFNSPMSLGMLNQIVAGESNDMLYWNSLTGSSPSFSGFLRRSIYSHRCDDTNLCLASRQPACPLHTPGFEYAIHQ
jgi:hypothetical protein